MSPAPVQVQPAATTHDVRQQCTALSGPAHLAGPERPGRRTQRDHRRRPEAALWIVHVVLSMAYLPIGDEATEAAILHASSPPHSTLNEDPRGNTRRAVQPHRPAAPHTGTAADGNGGTVPQTSPHPKSTPSSTTSSSARAVRVSAGQPAQRLPGPSGPADRGRWCGQMVLDQIPVGYLYTIANPRTDWGFTTEPDPGLAGRRSFTPGAGVIGGLLVVQRHDPHARPGQRLRSCGHGPR